MTAGAIRFTNLALETRSLCEFVALAFLLLGLAWFVASARAQAATATVNVDVTLPANTPTNDTIYITGNFQNWNPGTTPLTRDSLTHAHGTITVPEGTALQFKFTRGDFGRVEKASDCSELPNRTATATNNSTIVVTVANWADVCIAFYDGRAQKVQLPTNSLGVGKEFYVYTPPGYAQTPGRRYPVLYLFRGHESEWINKQQDGTRGGRNVIDVYEQLLSAHQVGPMLLVFPGMSSNDNSVPGMATNFKSPALTTAAGVGNGRFEDYIVNDVIGYVDSHFRTVASKAGRGVDGFSLGGFMSAKIGAQHPELFKTVGVFDGTHFYSRLTCHDVDVADNTFQSSMFDPIFGSPRDTAFAALNNGPSLICNSTPAIMQSVHWFVQYGPLSSEPNNSNYLRGEHLVQKLTDKGVTNEIAPVLEGGHNWATADEHMRQTLPLHWSVLGSSSVLPASDLRITSIAKDATGKAVITGTGIPLERHYVEATASLVQPFSQIAAIYADADGKLFYEDQDAGSYLSRFYRLTYP